MIRRATDNDLDACVKLCIEFFSTFLGNHGVPVIEADVRMVAIQAIASNQLIVVEHDGEVQGLAAWACIPHPANQAYKIFYETIWCVKSKFKTDTLLLFRALEREAIKVGADLILMANLANDTEDQVRRIFLKRGFSFIESHYGRTIKGGIGE